MKLAAAILSFIVMFILVYVPLSGIAMGAVHPLVPGSIASLAGLSSASAAWKRAT